MPTTDPISSLKLLDRIPGLKQRWPEYAPMLRRMEFPARSYLLREGEIPWRIFFIEKGCLRTAINSHGKDVTTQFFLEGSAVASIEGFRTNCPSPISIRAVEQSTVLVLLKTDFDKILHDLPDAKDFLLELAFRRFMDYSHLFTSYLTQTPRQRYLALLKEHPEIVQRIPQHYIASYLGITPVSLSRIRNRL
jgi:CRP-like cAMP-binding protein